MLTLSKDRRRATAAVAIALIALLVVTACDPLADRGVVSSVANVDEASNANPPQIRVTEVASGLQRGWDLGFLPDGSILYTERGGRLKHRDTNGRTRTVRLDLDDLFVNGETGLMALEIDPDFARNRRFFTCQGRVPRRGAATPEVQVVSWTLSTDRSQATRLADPLVGGLPITTGRHGGCRVRLAPDGQLWIGTGDGAIGTTPQDLDSLGGKILRVDPDTGEGSPGNPFADDASADRRRIYSYGHRNVQGLAIRPGDGAMFSAEHGPDRDDEINRVRQGNAGWNPAGARGRYDESVPMTDRRLANSYVAIWSSGRPTLAIAGATFLDGPRWKSWEGALAVATLKNRTLEIFFVDRADRVTGRATILQGQNRRLRSPVLGPDGDLYVTTDSATGAKILRITPR